MLDRLPDNVKFNPFSILIGGAQMIRSMLAAALVASALSSPALAQEAAPASDRVVVQGGTLNEMAEEFVNEAAAPALGRGHARWDRRVCVSVHNLRNDVAQYMVDRISEVALELDLNPGDPGCEPQLVVIFSVDGQVTTQTLVESAEGTFGNLYRTSVRGVNRGAGALADFVNTDRPIRWWSVSVPMQQNGRPEFDPRTGEAMSTIDAPVPATGSRLTSPLRDDLHKTVVVVDASQLGGVTWTQLADYIAMVGLGQVNPEADLTGYDSILNMFSDATPGLTDWDLSYLEGLYWMNQEVALFLQDPGLEHALKREYRRIGGD